MIKPLTAVDCSKRFCCKMVLVQASGQAAQQAIAYATHIARLPCPYRDFRTIAIASLYDYYMGNRGRGVKQIVNSVLTGISLRGGWKPTRQTATLLISFSHHG